MESNNISLVPGDLVEYNVSMYKGFTRVVRHEGKLCLEETFTSGPTPIPIDNFLEMPWNQVKKRELHT